MTIRKRSAHTMHLHRHPRSCLGVRLRFLVSLAHGSDRRTTHRSGKLSGYHHPTRLQSRRGRRSFSGDACGMDRGLRRTNERTSRQNFGVLKVRKQSRLAGLAGSGYLAESSTAPERTRARGAPVRTHSKGSISESILARLFTTAGDGGSDSRRSRVAQASGRPRCRRRAG
jgi:hypothetical protein